MLVSTNCLTNLACKSGMALILAGGLIMGAPQVVLAQDTGGAEEDSGFSMIEGLKDSLSGLEGTIQEMQDEIAAKADEAATLKDELTERISEITDLSQRLEDAEAAMDALSDESEAALAEKDRIIAELTENLDGSGGFLEDVQAKLLEAKEEIARLSAEAEDRIADAMEADGLKEQLAALTEEKSTLETVVAELEEALAAAKAALSTEDAALEKLRAERDALEQQRFWLSILVAISLLAAGFFAMRGRKA